METNYTPEQVAKSISAAYDSVTLITAYKAKESLTQDETDILSRNVKHIHIMLEKPWFTEALTPEQKTELEAI